MRRAIYFFAFSLGSFFLPVFAYSQSAAELQNQIDAHSRQIQALQAEIAEDQKQLDTIGKKKNTLQGAVESLALSQKQLTAQISVTNNKIASANLELEQLGIAIVSKEETIAKNQAAIAKALRTEAQNETKPLIAQMLTTGSLAEAWQAVEAVNQFNRALTNHINDVRLARETLSHNRDAIANTKEKLVSLQKDLTLQKKSVDLNKAAQQKLLADTKNQESAYQKLIADKQAEEKAFEAALFDLASQLQYVLDPTKIPRAGKGVLRWPLDTVFITQLFGKTVSAQRLYTSGSHDGIDFRASLGTPVRAAGSGIVLEVNYGVAPNCQYGKWVIIKHPNGLATLYAHLSDMSVSKGTTVTVGQVIGFSGNTGYATGPHLHFGVYFADAVSFKQYACKSGLRVLIPIAPINAYLDPIVYL